MFGENKLIMTYTIGTTSSGGFSGTGQYCSAAEITSGGDLSFDKAPDYDLQIPDVKLYGDTSIMIVVN